jgi:hypothetical protein
VAIEDSYHGLECEADVRSSTQPDGGVRSFAQAYDAQTRCRCGPVTKRSLLDQASNERSRWQNWPGDHIPANAKHSLRHPPTTSVGRLFACLFHSLTLWRRLTSLRDCRYVDTRSNHGCPSILSNIDQPCDLVGAVAAPLTPLSAPAPLSREFSLLNTRPD